MRGKMIPAKQRDPATVIPELTWDTIAPPYLDHIYFQDCEAYPFRAAATGFDMVNAWWLIEAATLAYADRAFVQKHLKSAGLLKVEWFDGNSTQCYVASDNEVIIVVFRGTEIRPRPGTLNLSNIVADIMTDVEFGLVESGHGGKVHQGFKRGLEEVWERVYDYICSQRQGNNRTLWFTGHSLGAALATLAAQRYGSGCSLYTFGSPRVGDLEFVESLAVSAYRFVNHQDVVTRVPPPVLYRHVGELYSIGREGHIRPDPRPWEDPVAESEAMADFSGSLARMVPSSPSFIPQGILDHVPLLYATHIWNNIP
jgi:triacylglycerol lipase